MAFLELSSELTGLIPGLSPFLADTYINRAWVDICNARNWNFLQQDAAIVCPTQITAGSVAIVQYTNTVTCNAAASTALLAQNASTPTLTNMQIRFGASSPSAGQVYNIIAVDQTTPAAIVLTLDRVVVEATNAGSGYQCYRCYFVPPVLGGMQFLAWTSLVDMVNGWKLTGNFTSAYFDARDPQRMAQGLAYNYGSYETNQTVDSLTGATTPNPNRSAGTPSYELWPHPTSGQTFLARMKLKGQAFVLPTDTQPGNIIDDQIIIERALGRYVYPFAKASVGQFPSLKGADWTTLMVNSQRTYSELLVTAKRLDDEQGLQSVWSRGHGLRGGRFGAFKGVTDGPIDANYLQSHLVRL